MGCKSAPVNLASLLGNSCRKIFHQRFGIPQCCRPWKGMVVSLWNVGFHSGVFSCDRNWAQLGCCCFLWNSSIDKYLRIFLCPVGQKKGRKNWGIKSFHYSVWSRRLRLRRLHERNLFFSFFKVNPKGKPRTHHCVQSEGKNVDNLFPHSIHFLLSAAAVVAEPAASALWHHFPESWPPSTTTAHPHIAAHPRHHHHRRHPHVVRSH